ncbi:MAG: DUF3108 domain-containing protein [Mariprofundaceae bacterium]
MKYLFVLLCLTLFGAPAYASTACMPHAGEQITFSIGWEFVNAGKAVLNYSTQGESGYKIHTDARTNGFFDMFKKVRDVIVSKGVCVDGKMQSTHFELKQHENRYKANKSTEYLWKENKVKYTHNGKEEFFDVPAGHLNVIDAFTRVRSLDLKAGDEIHIPVFDSRKTYDVVVRVSEKKDRIRAPSGKLVECLIIEPMLQTAGIFSSKGKIKIWLSNDGKHVPMKVTAKIKIGRVIARLIDYKEPS